MPMIPLVPFWTSGVQRRKGHEYRSFGTDPQFAYRLWWQRPRFIAILLDPSDGPLDPMLYVDRGDGFNETDTVVLHCAARTCFVLDLSAFKPTRAIRFDPSSAPGAFLYRAIGAWTRKGFERVLTSLRQGRAEHFQVVDVVPPPFSNDRVRKKIRKPPEHYAEVLRMAERATKDTVVISAPGQPFISFVVPVFNTKPKYLDDLLASFRSQPPGSAELILSDDSSTSSATLVWLQKHESEPGAVIVRRHSNGGIGKATAAGIEVARGEWVSFVDHDDALSKNTVKLLAKTAAENPSAQFIYTDEVIADEKLRPVGYHLKPAYDPVLLSGVNYINHLSCYRRTRLEKIGSVRSGFDGSQDYDLLLRYLCDLKDDEVLHLPYPAYLWRRSNQTFSATHLQEATANARHALSESYFSDAAATNVSPAIAPSLHRIRFDRVIIRWPRVSIVIPNLDSFSLMSRLLQGLASTHYPDFEIIVVDNGSTDPRVLDLYRDSERDLRNFRYEIKPAEFDFSAQVNRGIELSSGELVLLLNSDTEIIEPHWLHEMVSCMSYPNTGIVGARLLYPNRRIQHAGVIVGIGNIAGHWFVNKPESFPGPMARLHVRQSFTAVTGACMLISRACLNTVGRFDARFPIAFNDVDFCLRAVAAGFRIVWTPFATLIHHESASRGSDDTGKNRPRFQKDKELLQEKYSTRTFQDRAFSPWYTRDRADPLLWLPDQLPLAR